MFRFEKELCNDSRRNVYKVFENVFEKSLNFDKSVRCEKYFDLSKQLKVLLPTQNWSFSYCFTFLQNSAIHTISWQVTLFVGCKRDIRRDIGWSQKATCRRYPSTFEGTIIIFRRRQSRFKIMYSEATSWVYDLCIEGTMMIYFEGNSARIPLRLNS